MENHKGFTGAEPVGRLALRVSYLEGALLNRMPSIAEPRANICYQPILAVFLYFIFIYNLVSYQFFLLSTFSFDTVLLIMFDLFSSQVEPVSHKPLDWDTSWSTTFLVIFTFRTMWVYYMCYTGCFAFYIYIYILHIIWEPIFEVGIPSRTFCLIFDHLVSQKSSEVCGVVVLLQRTKIRDLPVRWERHELMP